MSNQNPVNQTNSEQHVSKEVVCKSASETLMKKIEFQHKWTVDHFSIQQELSRVGESLESTPFGIDEEYVFRLKLFPCGKGEDCRGYLSLFLQIQKCPSAKIRFRVNFYVETTDGPRGTALNKNVVVISRGGIVTASKFFSMDVLKQRMNKFVPDDKLTIGVQLTVYGDHFSRELCDEDLVLELAQPGSMEFDFTQLFASMSATDVYIHVGTHVFDAHRAILMARSPVFQSMFDGRDTQEASSGVVDIRDCSVDGIRGLIEFMYTNNCTMLKDCADDVLEAADKYCTDRLKEICERYLSNELTLENVCSRLRVADFYNASVLKNSALKFLFKNCAKVLHSQAWNKLEIDCPALAAKLLKTLMTCSKDGELILDKTTKPSTIHGVQAPSQPLDWPRIIITKNEDSEQMKYHAHRKRILIGMAVEDQNVAVAEKRFKL